MDAIHWEGGREGYAARAVRLLARRAFRRLLAIGSMPIDDIISTRVDDGRIE
jgi:hypothetical protein